MNPEMMLSQLAPLREPTPIGWWPLAPGWWGVTIALLVALIMLWIWVRKRRDRRSYRRLALAQLASLRAQKASAASVNRLLKAAALRAFPYEPVASLHGEQWLSFLHQRCASLPPEAFNALETRYQQHPIEVSDALFDAAEHWIKHHEADHA